MTDPQDENERLEAALNSAEPTRIQASTKTKEDTKASEPQSEAKPEPKKKPPAGAKKPTAARELNSAAQTQHEADVARELRLKDAQADMPPEAPVTDAELAELERKAKLHAELGKTADEIQKHEDAIEVLKAYASFCMGKLYPASVESDRHVDAVRGYLKASQEERRTRGAHPMRLKELLAKAGKAPIDAAFQRAKARGQGRPTRSPLGQGKAPGQEQAKDAIPGSKA